MKSKNTSSDRKEDILNLLALTFVPMTQYEMAQYLSKICPSRDASATVGSLMRNHTLIDAKSHTYTSRYLMTLPERLEIIGRLVELPDKEKNALLELAYVQRNSLSLYYEEDATSQLRKEMLRCLLYPQYAPASAKERPGSDYASCDAAMVAIVNAIIKDSSLAQRYEILIRNLPAEILYGLTETIYLDVTLGCRCYDYDRIRQIVDADETMIPEEKTYFCEFLSWPTRLYRDNFTYLGFDATNVSTWYGYVTLGVLALENDEVTKAEKLFRAAIKYHEGHLFENAFINLMVICALKRSSSAMALKTLDSYVRKDAFKQFAGHKAVSILLQSFSKDVDEQIWAKLDDASRVFRFSDRAATLMIARKMGVPKEKIPNLCTFGQSLEGNADAAIFQRTDLIPYVVKERWERAYDNVMAKLGYGKAETKASEQKAEHSKIVYLIGADGDYFQPVLKKSKDGLSWTKGRNIALKTFSEGIPEMGELDRSVASHVKSFSNYWGGGRNYELGGPLVMAALAGYGDIYKMDNPEIKVNVISEAPYLLMEKKPSGIKFRSNVVPEQLISNIQIVKETDMLYRVIRVDARQRDIIQNLTGVTFPQEAQPQLKSMLGFLGRDIVIHSDADEIQTSCETVPASSLLTIVLQPENDGLKVDLYAKPFVNEAPYLAPGEGARSVMASIDGRTVRTTRNFKAEKENLEAFLDTASDILGEKRGDGSFGVQGAEQCLSLVDALRGMGESVRTEWPEGCSYRICGACDLKDLNIVVKSGVNWFEMTGELKISEDRLLSIANLLSLVTSSKGRFIKIGENEFISISDKLRQQLGLLSSVSRSGKGGKMGMPSVAVPVISGLRDAGAEVSVDAAGKKLIKAVEAARDTDFEIPKMLKAELRPYQEEGYRWLCRLASWGAGACLADDMGLGKTVQTIALLLQRASDGAALVVSPASVAANWAKEIMRFAPTLQVLALNDMDEQERKRATESAAAYDVVLTTYGVLLSEIETISAREWNTAVLDEAHMIKNRDTKSSSACMKIKAGFRMILTGTPLQNNVGELWNLFQFINPGYLGSYELFNERFLAPIQERGDKVQQDRLKRMVLPFMLRRTKTDVLEDLPPKTQQYIYVDMDDAQTTVYESIRRQAEASAEEHQLNLVETLAQITRLRMAACSASLVDKKLPRHSAKTDELIGLTKELSEGGHKALVFSQFTSFLEIVREALDKESVPYLYLDGSTPLAKRQKLVKEFQTGTVPLFLISLKAGGLGLNLTAADYIIHTDPWWNPAIEDQASDRAYRIGQSRPVTVYHLLSRGTIEEKILELHRDKRSLADALLEGTDISSRLTREEILKLL